jgi:hypothetical protein
MENDIDTYQPEYWSIDKSDIYSAIYCLENGLEYARECLTTHETNLGRTTLKNKIWAQRMEKDIEGMNIILANLKGYPKENKNQCPVHSFVTTDKCGCDKLS